MIGLGLTSMCEGFSLGLIAPELRKCNMMYRLQAKVRFPTIISYARGLWRTEKGSWRDSFFHKKVTFLEVLRRQLCCFCSQIDSHFSVKGNGNRSGLRWTIVLVECTSLCFVCSFYCLAFGYSVGLWQRYWLPFCYLFWLAIILAGFAGCCFLGSKLPLSERGSITL